MTKQFFWRKPMSNLEKQRALSEIEASQYISMSRSFLRQSRMDGNRDKRTPAPPFIKIGRAVRYLRDDLDNWLDQFRKLQHLGEL
jgi:predicted DNA-binding transcriptional regulator AlpA